MTTRREQAIGVDIRHDGEFRKSNTGDLLRIKGLANLRQRLFNRLITVKGTLVHRPEYGVGIKEYQGRVGSLAVQRNLATIINEEFLKDPAVEEVTSVRIEQGETETGEFRIFVSYRPIGYNTIESQFDPFELEV
jgi:phage baseplate assembly protein W